jgi:hypothetical protein
VARRFVEGAGHNNIEVHWRRVSALSCLPCRAARPQGVPNDHTQEFFVKLTEFIAFLSK